MRSGRKRLRSEPALAGASSERTAAPGRVGVWVDQLAQQLGALSAREQTFVAVAAGLLLFAALVSVAVLPAWRIVQQGPAQQQALNLQMRRVAELAQQAQAVQARPRWDTAEAARRLQASSVGLGGALQVTVTGRQASVRLTSVPAGALANWLVAAREQAHAVALQAQLTRDAPGPEGADRWSGTVVLRLPP